LSLPSPLACLVVIPQGSAFVFPSIPHGTVISTGAAHAFVSGGAEKSASPCPPANQSAANSKNKVEKSGMFLAPEQRQFFSPRLPRISPHFHHQKTTFNDPLFQNTPQKHQQKRQNPTPSPAQDFF